MTGKRAGCGESLWVRLKERSVVKETWCQTKEGEGVERIKPSHRENITWRDEGGKKRSSAGWGSVSAVARGRVVGKARAEGYPGSSHPQPRTRRSCSTPCLRAPANACPYSHVCALSSLLWPGLGLIKALGCSTKAKGMWQVSGKEIAGSFWPIWLFASNEASSSPGSVQMKWSDGLKQGKGGAAFWQAEVWPDKS